MQNILNQIFGFHLISLFQLHHISPGYGQILYWNMLSVILLVFWVFWTRRTVNPIPPCWSGNRIGFIHYCMPTFALGERNDFDYTTSAVTRNLTALNSEMLITALAWNMGKGHIYSWLFPPCGLLVLYELPLFLVHLGRAIATMKRPSSVVVCCLSINFSHFNLLL